MFILDYDEELMKKVIREEGREEGIEQGREEGREEGIEQGREQGIEQGREEGREEGIEQGREEGTINLIERMLRKGKTVESIAEDTDIDVNQIIQIKDRRISLCV